MGRHTQPWNHPAVAPSAVGLGFAILYLVTCAHTAQGGDSSQFMVLAAKGGVSHPPGYPWFTALLRIAGAIPVGTVAFRASAVSAVLGACTLAVLCEAIRRLTGRAWIGAMAAAVLGLSTIFWRYATVPDVFTGGALTAALVVWIAVAVAQGWHGWRATLALGLAVATGIAHHHTVVLLAPLAIYAFAASLTRPWRPTRVAAEAGACAGGMSTGFAAYGALAFADGPWCWGDTRTIAGLAHHFLRLDYGTTKLTAASAEVSPLANPTLYIGNLTEEFVGVFVLMGAVGLVALARPGPHRRLLVATALSWLLAGPLFLAWFKVSPEGLGLALISRFHVLPTTLVTVFVGVGIAELAGPSRRRTMAVAAVCGAALFASGALHVRSASHRGWVVMERYTHDLLNAVEPGALVIGSSDNLLFSVEYAQEVQGIRPDVIYIEPRLLNLPWYREHLAQRHPSFEPESLAEFTPIPGLVAASLHQRPIYIISTHLYRATLLERIPEVVPHGAVAYRILPPGQPVPPPWEVEAALDAAAVAIDPGPRAPTPLQWTWSYEVWAYQQYASGYMSLVAAYAGLGDVDGELRCLEKAGEYDPRLVNGYLEQRATPSAP